MATSGRCEDRRGTYLNSLTLHRAVLTLWDVCGEQFPLFPCLSMAGWASVSVSLSLNSDFSCSRMTATARSRANAVASATHHTDFQLNN